MQGVPVNCRIPATPVAVSAAFVQYLLADGMFLPADAYPPSGGDDDDADQEAVHDEQLDRVIQEALAEWGAVTVKVDDQVAPTDADWMMPYGNTKCCTVGHVYMALKASNRVQEHLASRQDAEITVHVQQWVEGPPNGEWRCYTRGARLLYAGQRYPVHSIKDLDVAALGKRLDELWRSTGLSEVFHGCFEVDLWLQNDGRLLVLGAAPATEERVEQGGLFSWQEVSATAVDEEGGTVVRALTGEREMATSAKRAVGPEETPEAMAELRELMKRHEQEP